MSPGQAVIAVDPGRDKCGLAVVSPDGQVLSLQVVDTAALAAAVTSASAGLEVLALLVGDGTGRTQVLASLSGLPGLPAPEIVPEHGTTLRARDRYFRDHPPRGWRFIVPRGLLVPPRPVDDYAALLLVEEWLVHRP